MSIFEEKRQAYRDLIPLTGEGEQVGNVQNICIGAKEPNREIPLRIYTPLHASEDVQLPVFIFAHGGGFISGDLDTHDVMLRSIANRASCVVVSVGYRLAPEHPFPAALDDVFAVVKWSSASRQVSIMDGRRLVVGGDSAGGNLAAATAIMTKNMQGLRLLGQWLMYPTLRNKLDTDSWIRLGDKYFPTREEQNLVLSAYVPDGENPCHPLIAPLWADHTGLPPTLIQVGELDPLHDECIDFAERLEASGTSVQLKIYSNLEHGFIQFFKNDRNFSGADKAFADGITWLRLIFSDYFSTPIAVK